MVVEEKVWETYVCASQNFRKKDEDKQPLDVFYENERKEGEGSLEFCVRRGWGKYIWQMLVVDYLILNRDRHGANIEVLRDKKKESICLAPLFDHGLSLLCRCEQDEYYLEEITKAELPDEIQKRFERRVEDVVVLGNCTLLVFFRDGVVRKCDLTEYFAQNRRFAILAKRPD